MYSVGVQPHVRCAMFCDGDSVVWTYVNGELMNPARRKFFSLASTSTVACCLDAELCFAAFSFSKPLLCTDCFCRR